MAILSFQTVSVHLAVLQDMALDKDMSLGGLDLTISSRIRNTAKMYSLMKSRTLMFQTGCQTSPPPRLTWLHSISQFLASTS